MQFNNASMILIIVSMYCYALTGLKIDISNVAYLNDSINIKLNIPGIFTGTIYNLNIIDLLGLKYSDNKTNICYIIIMNDNNGKNIPILNFGQFTSSNKYTELKLHNLYDYSYNISTMVNENDVIDLNEDFKIYNFTISMAIIYNNSTIKKQNSIEKIQAFIEKINNKFKQIDVKYRYSVQVSLKHVRNVPYFPTINKSDMKWKDSSYEETEGDFRFFNPPYYSTPSLGDFGFWSSKQLHRYDHWMLLNSSEKSTTSSTILIESMLGQICEHGYSVSILQIPSAMDYAVEQETTINAAVKALVRNMGGDLNCRSKLGDNEKFTFDECVIMNLRYSLIGLKDNLPKHCLNDRWWQEEVDNDPDIRTCARLGLDYIKTINVYDTINECSISCKRFGEQVNINKSDYVTCDSNLCCIAGMCMAGSLCEKREILHPITDECNQKTSLDIGCRELVNRHGIRFCNMLPYSDMCCMECALAGHSFSSDLTKRIYDIANPALDTKLICYKCGEYPLYMRSSCLKNFRRQKPVYCTFACYLFSAYDVETKEWTFARGCSGPAETKFSTKCMYPRGIKSELDQNLLIKCCNENLCNNSTYFFLEDDQIWDNFKAKMFLYVSVFLGICIIICTKVSMEEITDQDLVRLQHEQNASLLCNSANKSNADSQLHSIKK